MDANSNPNQAVSNLIAALSGTREFNELKHAKTVLERDPQTAQMFGQFQQKQEMLQSPNLSQAQAQRLIEEINAMHEQLSAIGAFQQYFKAAEGFGGLLGQVMDAVHGGLNRML